MKFGAKAAATIASFFGLFYDKPAHLHASELKTQ
jgi:hypothetical protein